MNYLAHAYLSGDNNNLLIGNFIADHLRGNDFKNISPAIIEGILLHRQIDTFTDSHSEFKKVKRLFYNGFEKHSGILVDIYFDYLLAKKFELHHHQSLQSFSHKVYQIYSEHQHIMPQSSTRFLDYVIKNNIYNAYGTLEGIEKVLFHLSQRIKHNVSLHDSVLLFKQQEAEITVHFNLFIEDLKKEFIK